jgi:hypothetical protein
MAGNTFAGASSGNRMQFNGLKDFLQVLEFSLAGTGEDSIEKYR